MTAKYITTYVESYKVEYRKVAVKRRSMIRLSKIYIKFRWNVYFILSQCQVITEISNIKTNTKTSLSAQAGELLESQLMNTHDINIANNKKWDVGREIEGNIIITSAYR